MLPLPPPLQSSCYHQKNPRLRALLEGVRLLPADEAAVIKKNHERFKRNDWLRFIELK